MTAVSKTISTRIESLILTHTSEPVSSKCHVYKRPRWTWTSSHLIFIIFIIIAVSRTSLSSFATSFRSPKMFSRSFTMPLICRLTRTLLTPPSASALPDILGTGTRTGPGPGSGHPNLCCAACPLMAITHVNVRMFSYRCRRISSSASRWTRACAVRTQTLMNPE